MNFEYKIEKTAQGFVKISLSGELMERSDSQAMLAEYDKLTTGTKSKVILYLKDLRYMNSTGLNVMIGMFTKARRSGGEMIVAEVSDKVKELFVVTKLNTVFSVVGTLQEAEERLASSN